LSLRVEKMVAEVLSKRKNVATLATAPASAESDPQQKYNVADFQTKFDDLLPKIMKKRSDVKKGRFSMGDEVLNLNLEKGADAVVFIRGEGKKLTGGKTAFTLLVGGVPAYLRLQIGMRAAVKCCCIPIRFSPAIRRRQLTGCGRHWRKASKSYRKLRRNSRRRLSF
jgi:hypothetical protein